MTPASLLNIRHPLGRFARFAAVVLCALALWMVLLHTLAKPLPAMLVVSGCIPLAVVSFVIVPARRAKQR